MSITFPLRVLCARSYLAAAAKHRSLKITDLPFIKDHSKRKSKRRSMWDVQPTGRYGEDFLVGEYYAMEFFVYLAAKQDPGILSWIVKEMPAEFSGIEAGFFWRLEEYLLALEKLSSDA